MTKEATFAEKVLQFNHYLSSVSLDVPMGFNIINPFSGVQKEQVRQMTVSFYQKYYNDTNTRRLILGSSPARRGSAITGVPFEDVVHLQKETGVSIDGFHINQSSSEFLYDVIEAYGGCTKFYATFYMNFVCPLGICKTGSNGRAVNYNYYESKKMQDVLYPFILHTLYTQVAFGVDTSVCYCIGSGGNYSFLSKVNKELGLFQTLVPLEHPRFIMQYNAKRKAFYLQKYLDALCI